MVWVDIEKAFNRAALLSFSRKKILLTLPTLLLCGILTVFCRALAYNASDWMALSLTFLPLLLSSALLLALGSLLAKIHSHEVKALSLTLRRLITGSLNGMLETSYLSIPPLLVYLLFWIGLGLFFLLKEIPGVGPFFSVVFSFAPFLLILGSLILCLFNLGLLFFVAPAAAFESIKKGSFPKKIIETLKNRFLSALILFSIALIPILLVTGLLSLSAILTNGSFFSSEKSLFVAMEWFFIMIPFAALLTPVVIFFFNFATESYHILQRPQ